MNVKRPRQTKKDRKQTKVAIYHVVYENEGFAKSSRILFDLIKSAEAHGPGKDRVLYLDIEGHRFENGAFDDVMMELHKFVIDTLMPFLAEAHMPLSALKNQAPQRNDVPDHLPVDIIKWKGTEA